MEEDNFDYRAAWYAFMQCVYLARLNDLDLIVSPIGSMNHLYIGFADAGDVVIAGKTGKDAHQLLQDVAQQLHAKLMKD